MSTSIVIDSLPQHLQQPTLKRIDALEIPSGVPFEQLTRVIAVSQYVSDSLARHPDLFKDLHAGDLYRSYHDDADMAANLPIIEGEFDEDTLHQQLRAFRRREMTRIIWRDLNRLADMSETTLDISRLAEISVQHAMSKLRDILAPKYGVPMSKDKSRELGLVVLGMGKLGARELNLSSDIDLIFAFPEHGYTLGGDKELDNAAYFTRFGQRLIKAIDQMTVDGFVFRVDMRLRPYGGSGALALSFDAMEDYYQDQGRDWERYAMIKARPIAGDTDDAAELMRILRPFAYRRYIDFSVIESLRQLKAMIRQEVARKGLQDNIKLGAGGIREVEFITQSFQLVRGGRDVDLQERSVMRILPLLKEKELLSATDRDALLAAYSFLRNSEHVIQALNDEQTQQLPANELDQQRLAYAMGFDDWQSYRNALQAHRDFVGQCFKDVVRDETESEDVPLNAIWQHLWLHIEDKAEVVSILQEQGYQAPEDSYEYLAEFIKTKTFLSLESLSRQRIDHFFPKLLAACAICDNADETLQRILPLMSAVQRRTSYVVLLDENPQATAELVKLCSASPWVAEQLANYPVLLDELLDASTLYSPPSVEALRDELRQSSLRIPNEDLEAHMDNLRVFKMAHVLRVAACEITGRLALMKASDYLTWIAEVVVEYVVKLAREDLTRRHGQPQNASGEPLEDGFAVIGYGKMGGLELSYSSDLDMVFIYNAPATSVTSGPKEIDNSVFYTRLGQRILHIMNTRMASGILYEVDMRLRPSGASGLLVSSVQAFERYQEKDAWTWEHQALVRARFICGDPSLQKDFETIRANIMERTRDRHELAKEVIEMRQKMRDHLEPEGCKGAESSYFHLKHSQGGIVDIEFMVQYAVLAWSNEYNALHRYTDNIRILEQAANAGLITAQEAELVGDAYRTFRTHGHVRALQGMSSQVDASPYQETRRYVTSMWQKLLNKFD